MEGYAFLVALFAAIFLWYAARPLYVAFAFARHGLLNLPALVIGACELWVGGMFSLAAGTLVRVPPSLPERPAAIGWSAAVCMVVLSIVLQRKPEVEAEMPADYRRAMDGRYVLAGVIATVVALVVFGYL